MARRSARLASLSKASKPATEPQEAPTLAPVAEQDDNTQEVAPDENTNAANPAASSPVQDPKTPGGSSPVKPPMSEMHPSKVRPTMGPPSSALRLGFTDIRPTANLDDNLPPVAHTTPSRVRPPSSPFTFSINRPKPTPVADLGLSAEAQQLMEQVRKDAVKYKPEVAAQHEAEKKEEEQVGGRKIARAKGKAGRFSAAHMAEFKKMDSIQNHPSALRFQPGKTTPLKAGVKRSQSKANLDEPETSQSKQPTPASAVTELREESVAPAKRARQRVDEDASSKRPSSRDGSSIPAPRSAGLRIPRSKSNLASLSTPTKSSLARAASVKTPSQTSLARSPSKATLSGIPRSSTTSQLPTLIPATEKEPTEAPEVKSPMSRIDRVKAMLRGKATGSKTKSALPMPSAFGSKTPAPVCAEKTSLPVPMTTPGRKLAKHVSFTPETKRAALTQNSPSPVKSGLLQAKSNQPMREVHYPSLDGMIAEGVSNDVSYPDLSAQRPLPEPPVKSFKAGAVESSVPSDFTFRSDHTISFGSATTKSFGSSPGQASVRVVRPSILPTAETMPGSFPTPASSSSSSLNKENEAPRDVFLALPHGMSTKKRHRVISDEEEAEQEAAERAAKKRKQEEVPEGDALLAPRLVGTASVKRALSSSPRKLSAQNRTAPGTPSPTKKKGISLSRLNMLARPKMRK
ncbi:uncharacterized protein B0T15DRAFT_309847 [Chaetomium strumarium]|uniref:Erythromycin esterase n=1 Tax=Chaetomium strumarium TaxID=1170767 RepID=A0AAJ0LYN3_9PEZI|nr:hypothetical protein B0T15DRAFT_309847 [Chaetomium strumarium]